MIIKITWITNKFIENDITSSNTWKNINNVVQGHMKDYEESPLYEWRKYDEDNKNGYVEIKGRQNQCDEYLEYFINKSKTKNKQLEDELKPDF